MCSVVIFAVMFDEFDSDDIGFACDGVGNAVPLTSQDDNLCSVPDYVDVNNFDPPSKETCHDRNREDFNDKYMDRYYLTFYMRNYSEYEEGASEAIVKGRLKASIQFWQDIGTDQDILSIIKDGYKLPFIHTPPAAVFKNNKSALSHREFVTEAVFDLLSKDLIQECSEMPCIVNPLSVSKQSSGKLRLILDLRYVNLHLWKNKIKFEDWNTALLFFKKNDFMGNFDLKSGYHHIEIFKDHCEFLSFSWEIDGIVRYFSFQVLPFGLSTAPFIFTKTLRPLVRHWRKKGFFIVLFLDDGWFRSDSETGCEFVAKSIKEDLLSAGLVPNCEKSVWTPVQEINWLGMTWNAEAGSLRVIERRITDILECIDNIICGFPMTTARKLASLAGKIMSLYPVVGKVAQLRTRFLYTQVVKRSHWDKIFRLESDNQLINEVFFWKHNVVILNCRMLFEHFPPSVLVYSDASHLGCGAWIAQCGGVDFFQNWKVDEIDQSSTWRELKGVFLALQAFVPMLRKKRVTVHTDNKGVEAIIKKGSMKLELHRMAIQIAELCKSVPFDIEVKWIPRAGNEVADKLSRTEDFDDWGVSREFFQFIDSKWGPHSIDRFADEFNCKISVFNSKYWSPASGGVDAFSFDWGQDCNWLVPPIALVGRAISHVKVCKALATLVVPAWPSAPFWPLLFSSSSSFKGMVTEVMSFSDPQHIFVQGRNPNSIFGTPKFTSDVLCIRLDGRLSDY